MYSRVPIYWDTNAFLGHLKKEPEKEKACLEVLEEAEAGRILIVTSALTLIEAIKLNHEEMIPKEHAEVIYEFFRNEYIEVRDVDRFIAEAARSLVWNNSIKVKDSIHIATALRWEIKIFNTYDGDLLKKNGTIPGLTIATPSIVQAKFDFNRVS